MRAVTGDSQWLPSSSTACDSEVISQSSLATTGHLIKENSQILTLPPIPPPHHCRALFLPPPVLSNQRWDSPEFHEDGWLGRGGAREPLVWGAVTQSRLSSCTCRPHPTLFLSVSSRGLRCLMWWSDLPGSDTAVGQKGATGLCMDSTVFFPSLAHLQIPFEGL